MTEKINEQQVAATTNTAPATEDANSEVILNANQIEVLGKLTKTIKNVKGVPTEIPEASANNFLTIFRLDEHFSNVRLNLMSDRPEKIVNGLPFEWTPSDDAASRTYIEKYYKIANEKKWADAFLEFQTECPYNPVQDIISNETWDGKSRVETFLIKWLGAEDTPYSREVSRLLFAGGINRIYSPGCKFDSVVILSGAQGSGKSTICRWLAVNPRFYNSIKTMKGQKACEAISGMWICEIEELQALLPNANSSKAEEVKAFITTTNDRLRIPYTKRPTDHQRTCIFIGTTNRETFLTDGTGNRRFLPIKVNTDARTLYEHEEECRKDILQCWAEMKSLYDKQDERARAVPSSAVLDEIQRQQKLAEEDDYRIGLIEDYIASRDSVCLVQIYKEAICRFEGSTSTLNRKVSNELMDIMISKFHWVRGNTEYFGPVYKKQKALHRPVSVETKAS